MSVRLYVDLPLQAGLVTDLPPAAARHVQVRRLQPGHAVNLFNGQGGEWSATVQQMGRSSVQVRVERFVAGDRELCQPVTVAVGMPANDRMDLLVEKATELGVQAIVPLQCERSVLRLSGERAQRKREHWQAIAAAAAEQCGRTRVPAIAAVRTLAQFVAETTTLARGDVQRVLLSPLPDTPPLRAAAAAHGGLLTLSGPEGGLSADEEAAALAHGFVRASLGPRVLRAETAPLAVLAWIGLNE